MSDDQVQVSHLVPEQLRDDAKANAEHGELSEAVRQVYRIVAYGEDRESVGRLKLELEQARLKQKKLDEQREQIAEEIETATERIDSLESRIDDAETRDDRYVRKLESLEASVREGFRVFAEHADVKEAAKMNGTDPTQVISDLQERNPELPDEAFEPKMESDVAWEGTH